MIVVILLALLIVALVAGVVTLCVCTLRKPHNDTVERRNGKEANQHDLNASVTVTMPTTVKEGERLTVRPSGVQIRQRPMSTPVRGCPLIPRRMFQSYKTSALPYRMAKSVEGMLSMHEEMLYEFYDDDNMYKWLEEHCTDRVVEAVKSVKPGAYKCDIFRLAKLYKDGGWYFDIFFDSMAEESAESCHRLADYPDDTDLVLVEDRPNEDPWAVYQAMLGAKPKHPLIGYVLDRIVEDVQNRKRPECALSLTGPRAFGKYMREYLTKTGGDVPNRIDAGRTIPHTVIHWLEDYKFELMREDSTQPMMRTKYFGYRQDQPRSTHYGQMFLRGDIYTTRSPVIPSEAVRGTTVEARLLKK